MQDSKPQDVGAAPIHDPLADRFADDAEIEIAGWGDIPIVSTFGAPQTEYAALHRSAGLMALPQRGFIEVTGADRYTFLNNLLTNSLVDAKSKRSLSAGHGCYAFFLNLKGRIVADLRVLAVSEETTLLECDRRAAGMLVKAFDAYLFAEKVKMRDVSDERYALALHGPQARDLLSDAADGPVSFEPTPGDFPATRDLPVTMLTLGGTPAVAWVEETPGLPGVGLIVPRDQVMRVWDDLVTRFCQTADERDFGRRRLRPVGWAMFNAARIEAGLPLMGIDFAAAPPSRPGQKTEQVPETRGGTLPAETGPLFARAVSLSGGCYLGQEVVARMHARSAVARRIVGIRMDEDALPSAGAEVEVGEASDATTAGIVTSSTLSPVLSNACIALATIKRPHFEPGTVVFVPAEGRRARGKVVELPFLAAGPEA